ncbi:MAG TPA: 5-formyltetrahydrofolate cyclo-ligase [Caulobacteraceae bacterium]
MSQSAKAVLRARMRRRRRDLAAQGPDAAIRAAGLIPEALLGIGVVAGYAPLGDEFDPGPVMRCFAEAGARLARPAVRDSHGGLDFHLWREGDPLSPDALGVPSPLLTSEHVFPELVLAPLLAFDRHGGRLGQGGGYFDRAIAGLRARGPLIVVGLAFAGQEVEEVPLEAHDARLDAVLTEDGYVEFG